MLYDTIEPGADTPTAVRAAYADRLRTALADHDPTAVAEQAGVDSTVVEQFAAGDLAEGTLTDAAAVLGTTESIEPTAVEGEVRDELMLGMSSAILDVDTIAAEIDTDLTGQELQQALEGRTRIKLDELAKIHALIRSRQP